MDPLMVVVWAAVTLAVVAIYAGGWWVSKPMVVWGRFGFRLALAALLAGLTLPAEAINAIIAVLSVLLPNLGEVSDQPGASFGMHFVLFAAVATGLLVFRHDAPQGVLVAALLGLAVVSELLQWPIPGRFADGWDVVTNAYGVALGGLVRWVVVRAQLVPRIH